VVEIVQKLSGTTGVNFAVECTGVPKVVENMVSSLAKRGRGCSLGAPKPGSTVAIDITEQLQFGREYIGCCEGDTYPPEMVPYLIEQHKAGNFPIEKMIKYYDAKDFQTAFDDMKATKTIKPVLVWSK